MDGPEQGHTQATDPAAASKDAGDIEPVIKREGIFLSAVLAFAEFRSPVVGAGQPPHGWPQATFHVTVTSGRRKGPEAGPEFGAGSES